MKMLINKYIVLFITFLSILMICPNSYPQRETATGSYAKEMFTGRSPSDLMNLIIDHQLHETVLKDGTYPKGNWDAVKKSKLPTAMYWSYPTGMSLLGMQRVYDITKNEDIIKYVEKNDNISADQYAYLRWQKKEFGTVYNTDGFEKLWRLNMLDDCGANGAAILESALQHKVIFSPALKELVDIAGNYVTNVHYRLNDGTLYRPHSPEGSTIWDDDLCMSVPFLIRWSKYKNDPSALNDAARQIINFASYLQDADGVWFHAYFVDKKTRSCCKWGRGNGWVAVAMAEALSVLPKSHPQRNAVFNIYKKQIDGLIKHQSESGLWNQVIDHPELTWGTETSCSAQFAYAIARGINRGWLDRSYMPVVQKAFAGLEKQVTSTGTINKVCMSTSIGDNLEYYNTRSSQDNDFHGTGLMLLALAEIHILFQNGH